MARIRFVGLIVVSVLLYASLVLAQTSYYVQSAKAKILWEPSFKAKVMAEVARGEKLTVVEKKGRWVKVRYGFEDGYVSALLVSARPPMTVASVIKADETDLRTSVRRRASTYTSAAAARGLTSESRLRASKEERANYYALEQVEAFTIPAKDLDRFAQGGLL